MCMGQSLANSGASYSIDMWLTLRAKYFCWFGCVSCRMPSFHQMASGAIQDARETHMVHSTRDLVLGSNVCSNPHYGIQLTYP